MAVEDLVWNCSQDNTKFSLGEDFHERQSYLAYLLINVGPHTTEFSIVNLKYKIYWF